MKREKGRGVEREEVRSKAGKREEGEDREGRLQRRGAHATRHSRAALPPGSLRLPGGAGAAGPQSPPTLPGQRAQQGRPCTLMRQSRSASHTIAPSAQELTGLRNDGVQLPGDRPPQQRGLGLQVPGAHRLAQARRRVFHLGRRQPKGKGEPDQKAKERRGTCLCFCI